MHIIYLSLLMSASIAPAFAAGGEPRHTEGHRHGAAELRVVVEGDMLSIALDGPADNLLGFEHAPKTTAQKQAVTRVQQQLQQPDQLFALPKAAQCQAQPTEVTFKFPAAGGGETHSDVEVEWRWRCAAPTALKTVDVRLFKTFSKLHELEAQVVTTNGQSAAELTPKATRLTLVR